MGSIPDTSAGGFTMSYAEEVFMRENLRLRTELEMQTTSHKELEEIIRVFHQYCDPCDMYPEDVEVWRKWDRRFNPENYDEINEPERNGAV